MRVPAARLPPGNARGSRRVAVALVGCLGAFLLSVWIATWRDPSRWEVGLFRTINRLPGTVSAPLTGLMQFGALASVGIAASAAGVLRRARLARAVMVSGSAAWLVAKVLTVVVDRRQPDDVLDQVVVRGRAVVTSSFPSTHCAVVAALAVVASPYLGRFGRRLGVFLVVAVAMARVYVGAQFPLDSLGGVLLGATLALAYTWLAGAPASRLGAGQVDALLASRSIVALGLQPCARSAIGTRFIGRTGDGRGDLLVVATSQHEPGRSWASHAWAYAAFHDTAGLGPLRSPRERNEHGALMSVLAERSGVHTPRLCHSSDIGAEHSISVYRMPVATALDELPAGGVGDDLLTCVWAEVDRLHQGDMTLGITAPDAIVVDGTGQPWIIDLGAARLTADADDHARDVARVFAALLPVADPRRLAAAASVVLGPDVLAAAAAHLHQGAIPHGLRRRLRDQDDVFALSRSAIAVVTDTNEPTVIPPARTAVRNLGLLAAGAVAVYLLLGQVGQAQRTVKLLRAPNLGWVAALVAAMTLTYLAAAVALMGSTTARLPLVRTFGVQFAAAFSNRLAPAGLGGMATNVRYLERAGSERPAALAAVTVNALAGLIVHAAALTVVLPTLGPLGSVDLDPPHYWPLLIAAMAATSMAGIAVWIRFMPAHIGTRIGAAVRSLTDVLTSPTRATALFAGSAALTAAYALALYSSLHAFGSHATLGDVVAVYLGASAIAAMSPTPGGLGALEAALVAGLTRVGVPASIAVVGVLAYRLVTYWFPVLPGVLAFRSLHARGHL